MLDASMSKLQFACLYTKHKTQKRKVWKDGRLVLTPSNKVILHDAIPLLGSSDPSLDSCEVSPSQRQSIQESACGQTLETEKFLIEIQGDWTTTLQPAILEKPPPPSQVVSTSMQKILKSKFQRPKAYIPPHPATQPSRIQTKLGKRRRPLQPGELIEMYYRGEGGGFAAGQEMASGSSLQAHPPSMHLQGNLQHVQAVHQRNDLGTVSPPSIVGTMTASGPSSLQFSVDDIHGHQRSALSTHASNEEIDTYTTRKGPNSFFLPNQLKQNPRGTATSLYNAGKTLAPTKPQRSQPNPSSASVDDTGLFSNNGFNADIFYGLDEEDEDEENEQGGGLPVPTSSSRRKKDATGSQKVPRREDLMLQGDSNAITAHHRHEQRKMGSSEAPKNRISGQAPQNDVRNHTDNSDEYSDSDEDEDGPHSFSMANLTTTNRPTQASSSKPKTLSGKELLALFGDVPFSIPENGCIETSRTDDDLSVPTGDSLLRELSNTENFANNNVEAHSKQTKSSKDDAEKKMSVNVVNNADSTNETKSPVSRHPIGFYLAPAATSSEESDEDK